MILSIAAGTPNVSQAERTLALGGGLVLAVAALRRAPWAVTLAALGGALLYRGATGRWPLYEVLGISPAGSPWHQPVQLMPQEEQIDETIAESFPASDPPGWHTGGSFTQVSE